MGLVPGCDSVGIVTSSFAVDVQGGTLAVHELAGDSDSPTTILAVHGITANGLSYATLARRLPGGVRLLAPDLRGRAESAAVTGPWGLAAHVADLIAVLDHFGLDRVPAIGHSMGAYALALAAARHPDRFERVVLVDGGIGFPTPPGADVDAMLGAVLGPAQAKLSMTFADQAAYLEFMRTNPAIVETEALGPKIAKDLQSYLFHDLVPRQGGVLGSSCVPEAIRSDGADTMIDSEVLTAASQLTMPGTLFWAPRGLQNQTPGLLPPELVESAGLGPRVRTEFVPDCNHYSIVFADHALDRVLNALFG
ncbi:alpha/beta hydrolase [Microlunatus endophyticus]